MNRYRVWWQRIDPMFAAVVTTDVVVTARVYVKNWRYNRRAQLSLQLWDVFAPQGIVKRRKDVTWVHVDFPCGGCAVCCGWWRRRARGGCGE